MASDPDPSPGDPLPPPRPRPQPNIWWSLLACVGLTVVLNVAVIHGFGGALVVLCLAAGGNWQTDIQNDLNGLQQALVVPSGAGSEPPPAVPPRIGIAFLVGTLGTYALLLLLLWPLLRGVFGRDWPRVIAFRRPGVWQLLIAWIVFLPGMMFVSEGLYGLLLWLTASPPNEGIRLVGRATESAPVWLAVLAIGVGPGVVEEVFCRGFLGRGLVGRHGWIFGVALTSLLFGLLHIEPLHAAVTVVMGVCLHFTLATSRSLWVPILLHATNNALSAVQSKLPLGEDTTDPRLIALRYGSATAMLALGTWALWSCRAKVVPTDDNPDGWKPRFPGVAAPPPGSGLTTVEGRPNPLPLALAVVPLGGLVYAIFAR